MHGVHVDRVQFPAARLYNNCMEYLLILILFFLSAVAAIWRFKIQLYHSRREGIVITLVFFFVGVVWDSFAVYRQHWTFLGPGLVGIKIGLLPIEEYLFFLVMPFWIMTVYKVLDEMIR